MNERIKELAKQRAWHAGGGIVSDLAVDVIAELIVRECAEFCERTDSYLFAKMLKEHFGVEE